MPELRRLLIADDPAAWARAGFAVIGDTTTLGTVAVRFVAGPDPGVRGWELATDDELAPSIDGIATTTTPSDDRRPRPATHPNGVSRLDHVVITTPDLDRTVGALEAAGFEARRTRDVPGSRPSRRQVFLWAGEPILEVVGPVTPTGAEPAAVWGLALTTDDLDGAADLLGASLSTPKPAVQPGRRIATIDTGALGIGTALALMSPHPG